jgi:hypothetical protein
MTAEVAIMNAEAIALAADSAVTFGGTQAPKIFASANKIFTLSKYHPVGVMIYGSARLIGTPWETVIKRYRAVLGEAAYPSLEQYATAFIEFLKTDKLLFHPDLETETILSHVRSGLADLVKEVMSALSEQTKGTTTAITDDVIRDTVSAYIERVHAEIVASSPDNAFPIPLDDPFVKRCASTIDAAIAERFKFPITNSARDQLRDIANYILRDLDPTEESGVVVAGFGNEEVFPALMQYDVRGISGENLKFEKKRHAVMEIGIYPFAQRDVVDLFVHGVDTQYQQALRTLLVSELPAEVTRATDDILAKSNRAAAKVRDELPSRLQQFVADRLEQLTNDRRAVFADQMVSIVAGLPKEELASMAEALVSLTSLRRKVSFGLETVGGPVDVAVISKGDGFIWIKRKHYFDAALNPQFIHNYFRKS